MNMLTPFITQKFNGTIWRMEIDGLSGILFIEIRDEANKKVTFSSINLLSGELNFSYLEAQERWLTGIEAAYDGVLLLHNYQSATGPAHKGLTAVDGRTGEVLWSNYICAFHHLTINGPVLYDTRIQPKKLYLADMKTGVTTRMYEPSVFAALKNNIAAPQQLPKELLPEKLLFSPPYGNSIDYLEYNNFKIISLHTLRTGTLKQYLYVMDGADKVYEDLLNTDIQKLQPESFIVHKNLLIYIKNKSEIITLKL